MNWYKLSQDSKKSGREEICNCYICGKPVYKGDDLVENRVSKNGELNYIELAHKKCTQNLK